MGKLIYKDDNNVEHEIVLEQISSKNIKPGDMVVAYYEVGNAEVKEVAQALSKLRELIMINAPEGVNVVTIATRNGKKDIDLKIMKDKTKDG